MKAIKTLADLKRVALGTRFMMKNRLPHRDVPPKLRVVVLKDSKSIGFSGEGIAVGEVSYLAYPSASNFEASDRGFVIYQKWAYPGEHARREAILEYELVSETETANEILK